MNTNIYGDFQICISVPLMSLMIAKWFFERPYIQQVQSIFLSTLTHFSPMFHFFQCSKSPLPLKSSHNRGFQGEWIWNVGLKWANKNNNEIYFSTVLYVISFPYLHTMLFSLWKNSNIKLSHHSNVFKYKYKFLRSSD